MSFVNGDSVGATYVPEPSGTGKASRRKPALKRSRPISPGPPKGSTSGKSVVPARTYARVVQSDLENEPSRKSETLSSLFKNNPIMRI